MSLILKHRQNLKYLNRWTKSNSDRFFCFCSLKEPYDKRSKPLSFSVCTTEYLRHSVRFKKYKFEPNRALPKIGLVMGIRRGDVRGGHPVWQGTDQRADGHHDSPQPDPSALVPAVPPMTHWEHDEKHREIVPTRYHSRMGTKLNLLESLSVLENFRKSVPS